MSIRKRKWESGGEERVAWVLDYIDNNGKRRHKTFPTKGSAKEAEKKILSEISKGIHVADAESISISEAAELWISACERDNLESGTVSSYKSIVKYNIIPYLGSRRLNKITVGDIFRFQDELKEACYPSDHPSKRVRGRPRSRDAIRRTTMLLGAIIANAQILGKASHNPVYDIPRKKRAYRKSDREKLAQKAELGTDIPTPDEISVILRHLCGWYALLLVVAIFCGLRASELRGLRWLDIDFKKGVLHVRQRADHKNQLGPPKSKAGYRTIGIPPGVLVQLREWKTRCPPSPHDLVFCSKKGTVAYYGSIMRASFRPTMKRAGLMKDMGRLDAKGNRVQLPKYSGLHALRHWYASWCINRKEDGGLGLHIKQVQERMGHSSIQITMDTYGHLFPIANEADALAEGEAKLRNKDAANNEEETDEP